MSECFQLKHHLLNMQLQVDQNSLQIHVDTQQIVCLGKSLPRKKSRSILFCVLWLWFFSLLKIKQDFFFFPV